MDFISREEAAEIAKLPEKRKRVVTRTKPDNIRDYDSWFKRMKQEGGRCANPDCKDPRPKSSYPVTLVARISTGETICRYCFLEGYGA